MIKFRVQTLNNLGIVMHGLLSKKLGGRGKKITANKGYVAKLCLKIKQKELQ